jgi:hypothetical protein
MIAGVRCFNPGRAAAAGSVATGAGPLSVFVQGRYAYTANLTANTLQAFDLGGAYVQQLEAGGLETGTLSTRGNAQINGDAQVKGGLTVGSGGIYSAGAVAIASPNTLSIGVRYLTCTIGPLPHDCGCNAGETVVSGGGYLSGGLVRESRPLSTTTWRIVCANFAGADANCSSMSIICARLAP